MTAASPDLVRLIDQPRETLRATHPRLPRSP